MTIACATRRIASAVAITLLLTSCSQEPARVHLTVAGTGSGVVVSNPKGINCQLTKGVPSGDCAGDFLAGQPVTFTGTANADWEFAGWSGATCATEVTCTVDGMQDRALSASFIGAGGPGTMQVHLTQVPASAGGVVLAISGPVITGLTQAPAYQVRPGTLNSTRVILLVRGNLVAGRIADIQVSDRRAEFQVAVLSAAAGLAGGYAVLPTGDFQASVIRP